MITMMMPCPTSPVKPSLRSRKQQKFAPGAVRKFIDVALVKSRHDATPEFDAPRHDAIAVPMFGAWYFAAGKLPFGSSHRVL